MLCKWCANGRKNSQRGVYCLLFGIMIHYEHSGCKYFKEKSEGNATTEHRDEMDDPAEEERR